MIFAEGSSVPDLTQLSPILQGGSFALLAWIAYWMMYSGYPKWVDSQQRVAQEMTLQLKAVTDSASRREDRLIEVIHKQRAEDTTRMEKRDQAINNIADAVREMGEKLLRCPHNEYAELASLRVIERRNGDDPNYKGPKRRSED